MNLETLIVDQLIRSGWVNSTVLVGQVATEHSIPTTTVIDALNRLIEQGDVRIDKKNRVGFVVESAKEFAAGNGGLSFSHPGKIDCTNITALYTTEAAAEWLGVHRSAITRLIYDGKLTPIIVGPINFFRHAELRAVRASLYNVGDGMTITEIADLYGLSRGSVAYRLKRIGIQPYAKRRNRNNARVYDRKEVEDLMADLGYLPTSNS